MGASLRRGCSDDAARWQCVRRERGGGVRHRSAEMICCRDIMSWKLALQAVPVVAAVKCPALR